MVRKGEDTTTALDTHVHMLACSKTILQVNDNERKVQDDLKKTEQRFQERWTTTSKKLEKVKSLKSVTSRKLCSTIYYGYCHHVLRTP